MIEVRALGPVDVRVRKAPPPAELLWKKNLALLVYLARSPKRARTREHLVGMLWGDKSEAKARRSLNEALRELRRSLGDGSLQSDSTQVRVTAEAVQLDTDRLEALAAAGDYAGAASLVYGEFLEGFSVKGASEFDTWLAAEREHWRRRSMDVLVVRADQLLASGSVAGALGVVERARDLDWRRETAVRTTMRALALGGDRAGALTRFEAFAARLRAELGAEPDAETRTLAERVRQERTWRLPKQVQQVEPAPSDPERALLVGRAAELERLTDVWAVCRTRNRGAVAVIDGDPGTGKTRLAEELAARARLDGAVVVGVRAVEADSAEAWSGVFGIARGGLLEAPGVAGAPPAALDQLRGRTPADAPGRALSELLQAVAEEQPVVVFVDDAQWLDRDSLLALGATTRDLARAPVLCLITAALQPARPELDELRARLGRELPGTVVKVGPLDEDAVCELARLVLPSYTGGQLQRVTRRVLADTAGIPLLVVALLAAVASGLELAANADAWPETNRTLNDTLPGELPDNVVAAIRVNFRRLSANAQEVLIVAAVLGGRVSVARLERASGVAGESLAGALDELEWQRWLVAERRGYAFVAPIVRQVIDRDMVMEGKRQRIRDADAGAGA
ncbi:MAG TPA: AAA family ATPase [Gemmatimonadales bacterium]|nr:AAA family ATPase [Gemmatimonadales bacterium]